MDKQFKELKEYVNSNWAEAVDHCMTVFDILESSDEDIFYQMVFCLLVPAGNAQRTHMGVQLLMEANYFNTELTDVTLYAKLKPYIRFPKQKIRRLMGLRRQYPSVLKFLRREVGITEATLLRDKLRERVSGLGMKAASHFLRNVGVRDLAIIDVHILKYRKYFMPKQEQEILPTSDKRYNRLELFFKGWAKTQFDLDPVYLDWLIWCKESGNNVAELKY